MKPESSNSKEENKVDTKPVMGLACKEKREETTFGRWKKARRPSINYTTTD